MSRATSHQPSVTSHKPLVISHKPSAISHQSLVMGGFTLVELLVALSVFIVVLFVAVSSLLNIVSVYRVSQASRTANDNLNFALEDIAKSMRTGVEYHCGADGVIGDPQDCASADTFIAFTDQSGVLIAYRFFEDINGNGSIERSTSCLDTGCSGWETFTAPEVDIDYFRIFVQGTSLGDLRQPYAFLLMRGTVGVKPKERVTFNLQTTVSQRIYDS